MTTAIDPEIEKGAQDAHPLPPGPRFLSKAEVLQKVGRTYPTLWQWMREGKFPRARQCGARSVWLAHEVDEWMLNVPLVPLKGDQPEGSA